jgi:hypothetical protein
VRKVVDSNFLQAKELRGYFSDSPRNVAILTDYAAMEAYKGDTLASIHKSMLIVRQFPKQVVVLKSTRAICGLSARRSGLSRRMIDEKQTREFPTYCKHLLAGERGNRTVERQLLEAGREADEQMARMLADATKMNAAIDGIAARYSDHELRVLRKGERITPAIIGKILEDVTAMTAETFANHPSVSRWPSAENLANAFIFRACLCGYLLALDWLSVGGIKGASPSKLRNDMVDVNFAAYATYFDGLLSADQKTMRIYEEARMWLLALSANGA